MASHAHQHHAHHAHDRHEGHSPEMFRDKFWLSLVLTLPVVCWSEHVQMLLGYRAPAFAGSVWIGRCSGPSCSSTAAWCFCKKTGSESN